MRTRRLLLRNTFEESREATVAERATFQPTDLQTDMQRALESRERLLVAGGFGAERVLPVLLHVGVLVLSGEIASALLVAPSSELPMWANALKELTSGQHCLVRDSVTLISYEMLSRKGGQHQRACAHSWDLLLLDEGDRIANPTSNITQYFIGRGRALGLASRARYRYIFCDTCLDGSNLADLWAPLRFLLGEDWPYWQHRDFRERFLVKRSGGGVVGVPPEHELLTIASEYSYQPNSQASVLGSPNPAQFVTLRRCGRMCDSIRLDFHRMMDELEWVLESVFLQEYSDLVAHIATRKLNEFHEQHGVNLVEHCARNCDCSSLHWPKDFSLGGQRLFGIPLTLDAVRHVKDSWRDILDDSMQDARALLGMSESDVCAMQERILFERVRRAYSHAHRVVAHGRPDWLARQHLDVWLPDANVAIEFHGPQHFMPVDYFGGEDQFAGQRERDQRKRRLCEVNGCRLIVVDADYDWPMLKAVVDRLLDSDAARDGEGLATLEYLGAESELAKLAQSAMENREQMRFVYSKPDGTSTHRVITPIRFEEARGTRCLRGYCWLRKAERFFALSRMADVTVCSGHE